MHKIKILFLRCLSKSLTPVLAWMSRRQPLILSGEGSALRLCDLVPQFGGNSVLIATDKVLNELGLIEPLSRRLEQLGTRTVIYDGIAPDPSHGTRVVAGPRDRGILTGLRPAGAST